MVLAAVLVESITVCVQSFRCSTSRNLALGHSFQGSVVSSLTFGHVRKWHFCDLLDLSAVRLLSGPLRTVTACCGTAGFDAVDGAHSPASKCHKVVAVRRATLRGAVHGRGYHDRS